MKIQSFHFLHFEKFQNEFSPKIIKRCFIFQLRVLVLYYLYTECFLRRVLNLFSCDELKSLWIGQLSNCYLSAHQETNGQKVQGALSNSNRQIVVIFLLYIYIVGLYINIYLFIYILKF